MRFGAALGVLVAIATAVSPLRLCFDHEDRTPTSATPGTHGHEGHEGPDRDAGCCTDVPADTGGPLFVVHLDLPPVDAAEPVVAPPTPPVSAGERAPRVDPARTTVLLR